MLAGDGFEGVVNAQQCKRAGPPKRLAFRCAR
ncbi:hypothetical protein HNR60_004047 [Rhodopseudomonas rhenobacensis]|uniref:Uncharacterized protein n=1 Tax=Rhodopseudomonas rhenobacensis TaxID=87461 RepID=A0A7W7Z749_9BRAD|nr:hypothetical protein [Rhodopseudomonas rhenobacensis]